MVVVPLCVSSSAETYEKVTKNVMFYAIVSLHTMETVRSMVITFQRFYSAEKQNVPLKGNLAGESLWNSFIILGLKSSHLPPMCSPHTCQEGSRV